MGLFVLVLEGIEFPGPRCAVGFAVGAFMVCGFELDLKLSLCFRCSVMFCHVGVGIGKDIGVVLLLGGLVLLVGFLASSVELFAITDVEVAWILSVWSPLNLVDSCVCFNS